MRCVHHANASWNLDSDALSRGARKSGEQILITVRLFVCTASGDSIRVGVD